jgi:hypothetical protein
MSDTNLLAEVGELTAVGRQFEKHSRRLHSYTHPPHRLHFPKLGLPSNRHRELPPFRLKNAVQRPLLRSASGAVRRNLCESESYLGGFAPMGPINWLNG